MPENCYVRALAVLEPLLPAKLFNEAARVLLPALLAPASPGRPAKSARARSPRAARAPGRKHAAAPRGRRKRRNGGAAPNGQVVARPGERVEAAVSFLKETLAAGPTSATAIGREAGKQRLSKNALARARRSLNVTVSPPNGSTPARRRGVAAITIIRILHATGIDLRGDAVAAFVDHIAGNIVAGRATWAEARKACQRFATRRQMGLSDEPLFAE